MIPVNPGYSSLSCHLTDSYLRRTGVAETTFGRRAVNDPRLVRDLRRGRVPGPDLRARIEAILTARRS